MTPPTPPSIDPTPLASAYPDCYALVAFIEAEPVCQHALRLARAAHYTPDKVRDDMLAASAKADRDTRRALASAGFLRYLTARLGAAG